MSTDRSATALPPNVFGVPIDDQFVGEPTPPFIKARLAFELKKQHSRYDPALEYVNNLKNRYGPNGICCRGLVYNATGAAIYFHPKKDWHGHIWKDSPYPQKFENGQWAAFLHVQDNGDDPIRSAAGIVYRGKNASCEDHDFMCSWSIPAMGENKAFTMIGNVGDFDPDSQWDNVRALTEKHGGPKKQVIKYGCKSTVTIDDDHSPLYTAILTLEGVDKT